MQADTEHEVDGKNAGPEADGAVVAFVCGAQRGRFEDQQKERESKLRHHEGAGQAHLLAPPGSAARVFF